MLVLGPILMCGVVGIIGAQGTVNAAREAFLGLTTLQHRGQDGAGILTHDAHGFHQVKGKGLVENVFTREGMDSLTGQIAVGHTRYSTSGKGDILEIQPFILGYPYGLGMVHNGNIVNSEELSQKLKRNFHRQLISRSDTEVVLNLFAETLASRLKPGVVGEVSFDLICDSIQELFSQLNGSFSIITLIADQGLLAFRDPHGIRPLIMGEKKTPTGMARMIASESVALTFNDYEVVRNLAPGEVVYIDLNGKVHQRIISPKKFHPCMFEWVYFASAESKVDEVPIYGARIELGRKLARLVKTRLSELGLEADLVTPVPDTSRTAAIALAEELALPFREVLIKNRYIKRTFILASESSRKEAVSLKLSPVRSEIEGKRIILVDDSIVRGTTSRKIIELVRKAGAEKVYFVSTCPPIQFPCYYGIDFPSHTELVAYKKNVDQIQKELGADALVYMDLQGLAQAIGKPDACMACLTGKYPTEIGEDGAKLSASRRGAH